MGSSQNILKKKINENNMNENITNIIKDLEFKYELNPNEMVSLSNVIMMLKMINNEKYNEAITCL